MDYRHKASRQMQQLGWGTVELTTEALTEFEFDDSERGWKRSLDAWHILMAAWGVKVPPGAIARGLRKAGRPQPPHRQHAATIENAHAVRDELARAGAPAMSGAMMAYAMTTIASNTSHGLVTKLRGPATNRENTSTTKR